MKTSHRPEENRFTIHLDGRFDFKVHKAFREAVDKAVSDPDVREIQIDFSSVDYIDSSALGMLLVLRDKATAANRTVSLANVHGAVKQVLEIASFGKLFNIV